MVQWLGKIFLEAWQKRTTVVVIQLKIKVLG